MAEHNFARFFIVLNGSGRQSGYCKVESLNNNAVFSISARNIEEKNDMYFVVLVRGKNEPVLVGSVPKAEEGTLYKSFQTTADDVFGSGKGIRDIEAVYVIKKTLDPVLSGWTDKSLTKSEAEALGQRLSLLILKTENEEEGISSQETPEETSDIEDTASNEPINKLSSFTPYIETIQKLYEGLTGSKTKKTENEGKNIQASGYREYTGEYYEEMKNSLEEADFFDYSGNNTRWKITDNKRKTLLGLTYSEGRLKYIINCEPSGSGLLFRGVPVMAVWIPVTKKTENVIGYWCTFVDADTGNIVSPDFSIL